MSDQDKASLAQQAVPEGFALVPLRMNKAMQYVTEQEDWTWEDLLAAAEAITEDQYSEIAAAPAAPQASQAPAPAQGSWVSAEDVQRLARELDVAMNGEAGAAPAPQLCDVVAQAVCVMEARRAEFPIVSRWTLGAKDAGPRARVWVRFEDVGAEVEFAPAAVQSPAVVDGISEHDQIMARLDDVACPRCHGDGTIPAMSNGGPDAHEVEVCCDHCDGNCTAGAAYAALAEYKQRARTELIQLRYYVDHHKLTRAPLLAESELAAELVELDAIERRLRASVNWLANGQLGGGLGVGLAELRWLQKHLPKLRVSLGSHPVQPIGGANG